MVSVATQQGLRTPEPRSPAAAFAVRRDAATPSWLPLLPLGLFYLVFFAGPFAVLIAMSFTNGTGGFSLAQYATFASDGISLPIMLNTMRLGLGVAALDFVLGYAIAYVYNASGSAGRKAILLLVVTPLLTSTVVRAFAWIVILGRYGPINEFVLGLGLADTPLRLLGKEAGLIVAMAQIEMPLMVLPLISSMSAIPPSLTDASRSLGASRARTFFRVQFPLSLQGALSGTILVFSAGASSFISQSLIGNGRLTYMPVHLYEQAVTLLNWPFAAALAVVLVVSITTVVAALQIVSRRYGAAHG